MSAYQTEETLQRISSLNFSGNIIPVEWLRALTFSNGKPDLIAILILADIVYWYRLTPVRDEITGAIIDYRKKFKADMLQRSYEAFAKQLGITKRQAADAIKRLENRGLIHKEFRVIKTEQTTLNNVLFLAPRADAVQALTEQSLSLLEVTPSAAQDKPSHRKAADPLTSQRERVSPLNVTPLTSQRERVSHRNVTPPTSQRGTYTEITTEITTETTTNKTDRQLRAHAREKTQAKKKPQQLLATEKLTALQVKNKTQNNVSKKTSSTFAANEEEKSLLTSVMQLLKNQGISSQQLQRQDHQQLLQQLLTQGATLTLFQQALEKAQRNKQGQRFGLFYLRPIVQQLLTAEKRVMTNPADTLEKPMHYESDFSQAPWALEE